MARIRTLTRVLLLMVIAGLSTLVTPSVAAASGGEALLYLHGSGPIANPSDLSLGETAPAGSTPRYRDSPAVSFASGNPWQTVGSWTAAPAAISGQLTSVGPTQLWLGLKNGDDQGTRFDIRVDYLKNTSTIATGMIHCLPGLVRDPASAVQVSVTAAGITQTIFNGTTDSVALRILVRIGTNADDSKCPGHANAIGLRLYFDSSTRSSLARATTATTFSGPRMYVTNGPGADDVAVIDPATNTVLRHIPVGSNPRGIAASAVTHRVYAVNTYGSQSVSVIDSTTDAVIDTIPLGTTMAFNAAVSNDGTRLYLTGYTPDDASLGANLTAIDTTTNTVIGTLNGFTTGSSLAVVSPDGSKVYYADSNCCALPHPDGFVHVIDTTSFSVSNIEVGPYPVGIAVTPDGTRLYVANSAGDTLSVVDTASSSVIATIPTPSLPNGVTINSTGTRVYVTTLSGSVMVIDTSSNSGIATIAAPGDLTYAAVSPDDSELFVPGDGANSVFIINTLTNTMTQTLVVGFAYPWAVAAQPS